MPWEETEEFIRSGHRDSDYFDKASFRTIDLDVGKGIKAVIGCQKGHFKDWKCDSETEVQSYLFAKDKGWTLSAAKSWFKEHEKAETGRGGRRTSRGSSRKTAKKKM